MNTVQATLNRIFRSIPRNATGFHTYKHIKPNLNYQLIAIFVCVDTKTGNKKFIERPCTKSQARDLIASGLSGPFGWSLK
jgi:N-acetylmuramoyl-L-alanine amidase CwlA